MGVISINYTEPNTDDYKGVIISTNKSKKTIFNSGSFVKDWFDANKAIITNEIEDVIPVCHSSSVNHFIMDGAPFESVYLDFDEKSKAYITKTYNHKNPGIELFIAKGTNPTWEELKKICE